MKTPITKRTALSLAIAASLALAGGNAAAGTTTSSDGLNWTATGDFSGNTDSIYLYASSSREPLITSGSLASDASISLTATEATVAGGIYGSYSSTLTANSLGLSLSGTKVSGNVYGITGSGGEDATLTELSIKVDGESSIGGNLAALDIEGHGTSDNIDTISVELTGSSTLTGDLFGLKNNHYENTFNFGELTIKVAEKSTVGGDLYGLYLSQGANTDVTNGVSITVDGSGVSGNLYGFHITERPGDGETLIESTLSIEITNGSYVGSEDVIGSGNVYGIYAVDDNGNYPKTTAKDVSIAVSGSTLYGSLYGVYTDSDTELDGNISITVDSGSISGDLYGVASIYKSASHTTTMATTDTVTISVSGSTLEGSIYGIYNENGSLAAESVSITLYGDSDSGGVYGAYADNGSTITLNSLTLYITGSEASGVDDIIGVNTTDGASAVVTGDVTVNVSGSTLGERVVGAYNQGGSLEVGNISISFTGEETDTASIYGLGEESGAVTTTAVKVSLNLENLDESGNVFGFRSNDSGATSNVEEIEITITGGSDSGNINGAYFSGFSGTSEIGSITISLSDDSDAGSVYGAYAYGSSSEASIKIGDISVTLSGGEDSGNMIGAYFSGFSGTSEIEKISITLSGGSDSGSVYGAYLTSSSGSVAINDIIVNVSETSKSGSNDAIIGLYVTSSSSADITIKSVNVSVADSTGDNSEYVYGIAYFGSNKLTMLGDISVSTVNMAEGRVQAANVGGGTANLKNVSLYIEDIHDARARFDNVIGVWAFDGATVNVEGDVNVAYVATEGNAEQAATFHQDIFGIAIDGEYDNSAGSTVNHTGNVIVSVAGDAADLALGTHSVYGVIVGTTYEGNIFDGNSYVQSEGYSRILSFGYDKTNFTSDSNDTFESSFSNFDEVVVRSGSTLYLTSEQNAHLIGDQDNFSFSTTYEVQPDGASSEDYDFGPVESFVNIDGIVGRGGVLDMPADTKLTVEEGATANIMVLQNTGGDIVVNGTLTVYSAAATVETSTATNPSQSVNSTTHQIDSNYITTADFYSRNDGTITGTGTLVLESASSLTESETSKPSPYNFVNSGTINIPTFSISEGAVLDNENSVITTTLTSAGTIANGTQEASKATILTETLSSSGTVSNYGDITATTSIDVTAGTVTNQASASVSTNVLNTSSGTTVNNSGTLNIYADTEDSSIAGEVTNDGYIYIGQSERSEPEPGVGEVGITGTLTNDNVLHLYDYADLAVSGTLVNNYGLSSYGSNITDGVVVDVDDSGTITNYGYFYLTGDFLKDIDTSLNILKGTFDNKSGASFYQEGITTVYGGGLITNEDTMQFGDLDVIADEDGKGKVTGGNIIGIAGSDGSKLEVDGGVVDAVETIVFPSITNSGEITNVGNLMLGTSTTDGGVGILGDSSGTLDNSGTVSVTNLTASNGSTINNSSTIVVEETLTTGTSTAAGVTYTQTAGSFTVTGNDSSDNPSNDSWFAYSTVTITGGTIESQSLGTGNTYVLGSSDASANPAEIPTDKTNYAWYTLGVLDTSSTSVDIYGGSVLEVMQGIDMASVEDEKKNSVKLEGGTLIADLDWIFDGLLYDTIYVEAESPEDMDEVSSKVIITGVGGVIDGVSKGIYFDSGVLGLRVGDQEEYFSLSATSSIEAALAAAQAEDGTSGTINVVYDGHVDTWLTVDLANQVVATHDGKTFNGYATYALDSLFNGTLEEDGKTVKEEGTVLSVGTAVNVGGTEFTLVNSMGFKSVTSVTEGVYVNSGMIFNLVGETGNSGFLLADLNDDAAISIYEEGSTLELGSYGVSDKTGGTLNAVKVGIAPDSSSSATGLLEVKNGDFIITTLTNAGTVTVESNGQSELADNASLTVSTYTAYSDSLLTNSATFTATTAEVQGTGEIDNYNAMEIGTLTAEAESTVNNAEDATLNLTDASTAGKVINAGTLTSADLTIYGASENTGTWTTSGTLTVSGADSNIANSSTIEADALVMEEDSSIGNTGTVTVSGESTIGGSFENTVAGTFEAQGDLTVTSTGMLASDGTLTLGGDVTVSGQLDNAGTATASGTVTVTDEGILANIGTVDLSSGTLAVESSGKVANTASMSTSSLTIADSGQVASGGSSDATLTTDSFSITGGTLDIMDGTFTVSGEATLTDGAVTLGSSSAVKTEFATITDNSIGSQISVLNNSSLSLGASGGLDWAETVMDKLGLSADGSLLVMKASATLTDTGSIAVGAESSDGLYFDGNSTLVVDVNAIGSSIYSTSEESKASSAVFVTTASGATATVASGAQLVMVGDISQGRYDITQGYSSTLDGWKDNFTWGTEDGTVYGLDSSGLGWELAVKTDSDGDIYVVTIDHEDVRDVYDVSIPNIVNQDLDNCSAGGSSSFVCGVLRDGDLSKEDKEKIINSASNLLFAGGVMATSMTDATAAIDRLHNHLTMDSDTFDKDGNLWPWDKSGNLWIDVLGSWQNSKHLKATGISGYKYRANSYGFILGYDYKVPDTPMVLGAAFSFSDGDLKSKGGVSKTKNEYQTYGLSLFGNYSPSPYYNIIGSLHWFHNSADIKQYSSAGKATGKVQTNMIAVGLRGETTIKAGQVNFVPHAEARYIYGKSGKFTTKLDGANLWNTKADGTHTVQFPVGVAARADIKTESGWNFRPLADVYVIPQVGSTKQKSVVKSNGASDTIDGQFMGKFGGAVRVGLQADKGNATVGLKYGFLGGTKGRADHSVILQGRYRF